MKSWIVTVAVAAGCMSSAAFAQDAELKQADKKLNAEYKKIEARLQDDPDTKKLLVEAQRKWIAFRDAECKFQASGVEGGSVYPDILAACEAGLTEARVQDFDRYLSCEEGDLSCPVPAAN